MQVMEEKTVGFVFCSSDDNVADLLTKSLTEHKTIKFRSAILGGQVCHFTLVDFKRIKQEK